MVPTDDEVSDGDGADQSTATLSTLSEYNHSVYGTVTLLYATHGVVGDIPFNKGDGMALRDIVVFQLEDFNAEVRVQTESLFRQRI